jgi:hypothetical protein
MKDTPISEQPRAPKDRQVKPTAWLQDLNVFQVVNKLGKDKEISLRVAL